MADTNDFVVEMKNSGTEELKSNSESHWQKSEWIRKIRSGIEMASSGQNTGGDVPIKKLRASLREPVDRYTPRHWQFGLHNRDPKATSSESEDFKISLATACKLNLDKWDEFCADFVGNPRDVMLKSYGIHGVTELSPEEVQYLLTLDALTLVLVLSSWSKSKLNKNLRLPRDFIRSLIVGGFNIKSLLKDRVEYSTFLDDLFLCENQIPMALMKKAISKCYGLLPEDSRSKHFPELQELADPDSCLTKQLLDTILQVGTRMACRKIFAEPFPDDKHLHHLIKVGELENCPHILACIHKVMTTCVEARATVGMLENCAHIFAYIHKVMTSCVKACATVGTPPVPITTTGGMSRLESKKSATGLKKAGLKIQGVPGMVQQVAFKNGCLSLPIMKQSGTLQSYICNMAAYESWNTSPPFPFMDYLLLMTQLIKTPEDVSYLVDCKVIDAYYATEHRIFEMWESMRILCPPYSHKYKVEIVRPINRICASALNVMVTDFYNRFCSKPWLVISVISAIIFLVATLIQTYVLAIGSDKMQPHFPRGG